LHSQGCDPKRGKMLNQVNDPMMLVKIDQIERNEHPQRMNSAGRHDPDALVGLEVDLADQSSQASEGRIRRSDPQAEEAFACLVVYAVLPSFHISPPKTSARGPQSSGRPINNESRRRPDWCSIPRSVTAIKCSVAKVQKAPNNSVMLPPSRRLSNTKHVKRLSPRH